MKLSSKSILLLVLMLLSAALAAALRPTISLADERPPIDLAAMVPTSFGDWREDVNRTAQVVNPQQKSVIDQIYSQTLNRTYVNQWGYRVMLSIAYGQNQSDALQMHKPEICYPAQGFQLKAKDSATLALPDRSITVTRLVTQMGQRLEPVTYWVVLGDYVTRDGLDKKLNEMRYSLLQHTIPDGMLVRLSSLDRETAAAYRVQSEFATALVFAIAPEYRMRFAGRATL